MRLEDFIHLHKSGGGHFFDRDTMRFFRSRILEFDVITGYFITSEKKCFSDYTRVYSIRKANFETGSVGTVGEFARFESLYLVKKEYKALLKGKALEGSKMIDGVVTS
jgi:hypothetical protein